MSKPATALELEFIEQIGPQYLALAAPPNTAKVRAWRSRSVMPWLNRLHAPVTGLLRRHAKVEGQRMVWLEGGRRGAEPVVLVHGFGASKENWLPLLPFISKRFHLFVVDLPGWGESEFCADKSYGMDDQVRRLADWLASRKLTPAHVVGSSMGGGIAGLLSARYPHLVRSVVLMNAAGVAGSERTAFEQGLSEGRNGLVAHNMLGAYRLLATVMSNHFLAATIAPAAALDLISRRHVNEHLFRQLMANVPDSALPTFIDITGPAFILWGVDDAVLHVSCTDTFQQLIPHARQRRLAGIGHLPMVEAPRVTARILRRFWRDIAVQTQ